MTTNEMLFFFGARKISKATLISLQQTSFLPDKLTFKNAVTEFLGINELEIELAMGHILAEYWKLYYDNISHMAALLQKSTDNNALKALKPFLRPILENYTIVIALRL